jgi:pimeloyl-ACP methyl ester carboxylesterase
MESIVHVMRTRNVDRDAPRSPRRRWLVVMTIAVGVPTIGLAAFIVFVRVATYPPDPVALEAALSSSTVNVRSDRRYWLIEPVARPAGDSLEPLIYYPGGLVAPESYLRTLVLLSERTGRTVYLVRAPFNAAIFDVDAAQRIIDRYGLKAPIVGGHSLGGISACRFVSGNPEVVSSLLLLGSYCDRDLTTSGLRVISLMGMEDRIINRDNYRAARANLPADAIIADIAGLNHSAFGEYGLQRGDGSSTTSTDRVVELIAGGLR